MTSSDRFPVPVRSAVKSNLTYIHTYIHAWCCQHLSNRDAVCINHLFNPVPVLPKRGGGSEAPSVFYEYIFGGLQFMEMLLCISSQISKRHLLPKFALKFLVSNEI